MKIESFKKRSSSVSIYGLRFIVLFIPRLMEPVCLIFYKAVTRKKIMAEPMSMKKLGLRQCSWLISFHTYLECL